MQRLQLKATLRDVFNELSKPGERMNTYTNDYVSGYTTAYMITSASHDRSVKRVLRDDELNSCSDNDQLAAVYTKYIEHDLCVLRGYVDATEALTPLSTVILTIDKEFLKQRRRTETMNISIVDGVCEATITAHSKSMSKVVPVGTISKLQPSVSCDIVEQYVRTMLHDLRTALKEDRHANV